ncbi:hypothetical protein LSTR_LSTR009026 [Laodelphax striatellus]|uniref:Uncharacterized protein n=1 Tax=Laodelphax striatellus TaxID=195883 RepID=A0A482XC33_LAOST|nr:hypothetical protein LSTR_LSTR009026 [Laodelphax striatellus]
MSGKTVCSVIGCGNNNGNTIGKDVKYYRFPGRDYEIGRRMKWISNMKRINPDGTPWLPSKHQRICSDHFITKRKSNNPLHPDYVPTVFPRLRNSNLKKSKRLKRLQNRNSKKVCSKHFRTDDIINELSVVDRETGDLLTVPNAKPRLKPGSVPSIFPDLPATASTSKTASSSRTSRTSRTSAREEFADDDQDIEISLIDDALNDRNSGDSFFLEEVTEYKPKDPLSLEKVAGYKQKDPLSLEVVAGYKQKNPLSLEKETGHESLCRICGQMESDLMFLYSGPAFEMGLLRKIEDYLKIKIDEKGYLPNNICKLCIANLNFCDRFITKARNTNIKLHEKYSEQMEKLIQNEPPMSCQYCDKVFRSPTLLNLHLTTHSTAAVFLCEICGATFKNAELLVSHKRTHLDLNERKKHACTSCDKTFRSNRSALSYHQKAFHGGSKPYSCQKCEKRFMSEGLKRIHEHIHSDVNPFICTICDKAFKSPTVLNQHMRDHSIVTTYECPHCDKRFKRKGNLSMHVRTHTGEKPFACVVCAQTFAQKNDMLKHVARQHSKRSEQLELSSDSSDPKTSASNELDDHEDENHMITIDREEA